MGQGRFRIPEGYAEAALQIDQVRQPGGSVQICVLDDRTVSEKVTGHGRTWLDTMLHRGAPSDVESVEFGQAAG